MKSLVASILGLALHLTSAVSHAADPIPVGPSPHKTTPKAKVYVLKWKTRGWVQIAYQFQKTTSELIGKGVDQKMANAKAYGFSTKKHTDMTTVIFGTNSYRTYAYAKRDNFKEMTFNSKAAREAYLRALLKVVPSYTNDGPGLETRQETR
jgi:hypothetical protein